MQNEEEKAGNEEDSGSKAKFQVSFIIFFANGFCELYSKTILLWEWFPARTTCTIKPCLLFQ